MSGSFCPNAVDKSYNTSVAARLQRTTTSRQTDTCTRVKSAWLCYQYPPSDWRDSSHARAETNRNGTFWIQL